MLLINVSTFFTWNRNWTQAICTLGWIHRVSNEDWRYTVSYSNYFSALDYYRCCYRHDVSDMNLLNIFRRKLIWLITDYLLIIELFCPIKLLAFPADTMCIVSPPALGIELTTTRRQWYMFQCFLLYFFFLASKYNVSFILSYILLPRSPDYVVRWTRK